MQAANEFLTINEIDYLEDLGFKQNDKEWSGYYFLEDEESSSSVMVLIPLSKTSYKLEFYEFADELCQYNLQYAEYSEAYQDLEDFIEANY
jgi:hypothetical protein